MNWLNIQTSLFDCVSSNKGRVCTIHEALIMSVMKEHTWFFYEGSKKLQGESIDDDTIASLRNDSTVTQAEKIMLKKTLQCWTPSGCYSNKSRDLTKQVLIHTNPIIQFDFDGLHDYDLNEVKEAIFSLPFICCVGLSCSGNGLFALGLIEEPEKLSDYAKHCFEVFNHYQIPIDTTKGRNYNDLRFVTYDKHMMFRDDPKPLRIKKFHSASIQKITQQNTYPKQFNDCKGLIKWAVDQIAGAQVGQRFEVVRKVSFAMGGHNAGLEEIKQAIQFSSQFAGVESKYLQHAIEGFTAGQLKPIAA